MPIDAQRVQAVFLAATEIEGPAERARFLDEACEGDAELRSRVEALLRAHDHPDTLLDQPAVAPHGTGSQSTVAIEHEGGAAADDEAPLGFLAPATRPDSLGRIGHYEVLQVLGQGGFGIVFRAFDDVLHRVVAVKVLAPQMAATSPARKRFLREARSSAQVRHENVVQVYEVGEQPLPYIAMEFIPGETLQQRLDRVGPVEPAEVVRVGRQIAEGLAAAHATDLIHRDIKPGNVLLEGGAQRVKITDFGLARAADDASLSQSGLIAGTPTYMAPEQALGNKLDQRADLFSLGSVLYQMAAGRPPFRANGTLAVLKRVAEDIPRDIREVIPETPHWLCDIIAKLHAKNPDDRYQSAREVADLLADCEAQLKANGKLKDFSRIPQNRQPAAGRSGRWKWVAAGVALLVLLVGGRFGRPAMLYLDNRGEVELVPQEGLVSVIVLRNDEGVIDGNKLRAPVTDWLDMKKSHTLKLPPGRYQLNVGTWPSGTHVSQWGVTTSDPFWSHQVTVPVINSSAIVAVERGHRVTLRAVTRSDPPTPPSLTPDPSKKVDPHYTNTLGMKFKLIPPSKFTMGTSKEEIEFWRGQHGEDWYWERLQGEGPQHEVEITQPFYMGQTEITVGQFRQFVNTTGYKTQAEREGGAKRQFPNGDWAMVADMNWLNPGFPQTDDHPAVCVSWNDAVAFCNWLSKQEGKSYRMPTEAEWEYSCRAGSRARWSFGDNEDQLVKYARVLSNSEQHPWPVAGLKENAWGLHDMHGNVWEWCQDVYDANYYKASPPKDPPGPGAGGVRVARGGSGGDAPVCSRSAFRALSNAGDRSNHLGFRVLLVVEPPADVRTESGAKDKLSSTAIAPLTDVDVQRIAALTIAQQVDEARQELVRRNPGFDGKVEHKVQGGVVTEIRVVTDKVMDISPLPVFHALRKLDLSGTHTDWHGNSQLWDLTRLKGMSFDRLTELNLAYTKVTDAGLEPFKNCTNLAHLDLDDTKVSDAGMEYFANCKALTFLHIGDTQVGDRGLGHFRDCTDLTSLNLALTKVSDAGMTHFRHCRNLETINLAGTRVGDAGVEPLKNCKNLGWLDLSGTLVGDTGLASLKGCTKLRLLSLAGTQVTDAGLADLAGLDKLNELNLANTKVTANGVEGLAKALPKCKITWEGGIIEPK